MSDHNSRTALNNAPASPPAPADLPARWYPSPRTRALATAVLAALLVAVLTGRAGLVLLAAPSLGALALLPRFRRRPGVDVTVELSGTRCFEGEDVVVTARVRPALEEVTLRLLLADHVTLAGGAAEQSFVAAGTGPVARWVLHAGRWGQYSPGAVLVTARTGRGGFQISLRTELDPLEIFPRPAPMRPRLVPAELLRRIGEHTGRAVGSGVEFAGLRPYVPGDPLRDVNRAVSIRRRQLYVNQRAAARAADLVIMIDTLGETGPVADAAMEVATHGAAALARAYLRVADRVGLVVLGGALRWLGPAHGDRQFYQIAQMMLQARYDSFVAPDVARIPRTALPPGTLAVVFSPLLDPRGFTALTDLRQRGFPLIVVDTLQDEPPPGRGRAGLALRLWRLDRAATRSILGDLGVPVLRWDRGAELDGILAPLRQPPPGRSRPGSRMAGAS